MENKEQHQKPVDSNEEFEHVKQTTMVSLREFITGLFNIHTDTDRDSTIDAVKKDISFRGHNAWILIFSIFVASIGLNVSSTAVVIGAMLISPLMGPIVGVGLSVAINDVEMLRRSMINLGVMMFLSVLTAYLYFTISPLTEETPELVARTYPTILDVLVAIFGGLALIVAKTKKGTIASVIFGVAIATALMPPLCTVGYGLAVGNLAYAGGALYLFSINAVFIALTTFLVSKVLRFPLVRYANSKRRRFIARLASIIALIVIIPSVILFINLLKQQVFETKSREFVSKEIQFEGAEVVKSTQDYPTKTIDLYFIGNPIPQSKITEWEEKLKATPKLDGCNLRVFQGSDRSGELAEQISGELKTTILEELYVKNETSIRDKDERIRFLEDEIAKLKVRENITFDLVSSEAKLVYPDLLSLSYSETIINDFSKIDTLPVVNLKWNTKLSRTQRQSNNASLATWIKFKMKLDTLAVVEQ